MSLVQVTDLQAAGVGVGMDENALQDAIDEEEAWLARRIGPLVGERTQRFALAYLRPQGSEVILQRPTDEVVMEQAGTTLTTTELRADQRTVAYLPEGTRYTGVLEATYTPNDELEVRRAVKELVSLQLGQVEAGGLQMEQMGTYMYQRAAGSTARTRHAILRSLMGPPGRASSLRLRSSVRHGLAGTLGR